MATASNAINTTLYPNLAFNFEPRRRAGRGASGQRALWSWRSPPTLPGAKTVPRVHRLCEGQSGPDQHGLGRDRDSRRTSSANCSRCWPASTWCTCPTAATISPLSDLLRRPGAGAVRARSITTIEHIRLRQAARPRGHQPGDALDALPGVPAMGGFRCGLRGERLGSDRGVLRKHARRHRLRRSTAGSMRALDDPSMKARFAEARPLCGCGDDAERVRKVRRRRD